jgi:hypothetical protein
MLLFQSSVLLLLLSDAVQAGPLVRLATSLYGNFHRSATDNTTLPTQSVCSNYCGLNNELCCPDGASCITDSTGAAYCESAPAHLEVRQVVSYQVYTSTWTTTNLIVITSLYTSTLTAQAAATCVPVPNSGQQGCGVNCCPVGSYCLDPSSGQCGAYPAGYTTTGGAVAGTGSVAVRPTTISGVIVTQTFPATFTTSLIPAASGSTNGTFVAKKSSGLSGGAIAGIVIGVLLGIALLILFCICCCVSAGIEGIKRLFGLGRSSRSRRSGSRETIIEEEVIRRRRGEGTAVSGGRQWVGSGSGSGSYSDDRYSRRAAQKKTGTGWGTRMAALGAGLGTVFAVRKATEKRTEKSRYSGSGSYSYYTGKSTHSGQPHINLLIVQ